MLYNCVKLLDAQTVDKLFVVDALGTGAGDTHPHCFSLFRHTIHFIFAPGHVHGDGTVKWFPDHEAAARLHQVIRGFSHFMSPWWWNEILCQHL